MPSGKATDQTAGLVASFAALEDLCAALAPLASASNKLVNPLRGLSAATFGGDSPPAASAQTGDAGTDEPQAAASPAKPPGDADQSDARSDRSPADGRSRDAAQEQSIALKELVRHAAEMHALLRRIMERETAAVFAGPALVD